MQGVAAHLLGVRYRVRPDLVTRRCTFCVDAVVSDQPPVPPPSGKVADETARTESGSKPEEEAEKEESEDGEGLGGGLLGLGDYGSDDE